MKKPSPAAAKGSASRKTTSPDINVAISQTKAAGAVAGAALGAVVAGPIGAVVGGVVGTMMAGNTDKVGEAVVSGAAAARKSVTGRKLEKAVTKAGARATKAFQKAASAGGKAIKATGVRLVSAKPKAKSAPKPTKPAKAAKPTTRKLVSKSPAKRPSGRKS